MLIDIIAGARPNFMKIAPIIEALKKAQHNGNDVQYRLIHTGQHYDKNMSGNFFEQLGIPEPDINLEAGGGTQAEQTAAIMTRYEKVLFNRKPQLVLVVGDVTSTMACSITAKKMNDIKVAHVEAGIRSGDWTMPEEINRIVTYAITDYFFTTSETANENLRRVGIKEKRIPLIFPVHPRTARMLENTGIHADKLHIVDPLGYLEFNYLVKKAKAVITDSGGITEETTVMDIPCMTLRDTTERPETCTIGTNELLGTDPSAIGPAFEKLFSDAWKKGSIPPLWDGKTAERIVQHIIQLMV